MISLVKKQSSYDVFFQNGSLLGEFILDESGYFSFWQDETKRGCWSGYVLRALADSLDQINMEWDVRVHKELSEASNNAKAQNNV